MKRWIYLALFIFVAQPVQAQKALIRRLIKRFLSNEADTTRTSSLVPIPVFSYSQEAGFVYGAGLMSSFYLDKTDKNNRSSNIYTNGSISTKKQYSFSYSGDFWTKGNSFHIINGIQYQRLSNNFYGIGNHTKSADAELLQQNQLIIALQVEKKWAPAFYAGPTIGFEDYRFFPDSDKNLFKNPNITGKNGGKVLYLGLVSSYDNRDDNNYPTKGMYHRWMLQYAPNFFEKGNFTGLLSRLNLRAYQSLNKKIVLAENFQMSSINGPNIPFYLMQPLGGETIMRAYYLGRYRAQNMLAGQAEVRYRFMKLFSVVGFVGTGQVFNKKLRFGDFKPNYGAGIRYFFDIGKGLNIRLDYGVGQKIPGETRQTGFYFSMGEAF